MPKKYDVALRDRVVGAVDRGMSARAAAARYEVGVATAIRWARRWREEGTHADPPRRQRTLCATLTVTVAPSITTTSWLQSNWYASPGSKLSGTNAADVASLSPRLLRERRRDDLHHRSHHRGFPPPRQAPAEKRRQRRCLTGVGGGNRRPLILCRITIQIADMD